MTASALSHFDRSTLQEIVESQGLIFLGIVKLDPLNVDADRFDTWLKMGRHAGMDFLIRNREFRRYPGTLFEGAVSAIIVALPYDLGDRYVPRANLSETPRTAQYARFKDYHKVMWTKGDAILASIKKNLGKIDGFQLQGRVAADSAPLLERALAARCAKGFIGKNTLFIHPEQGSLILLGEILVNCELPFDESNHPVDPAQRNERGGCGTCRRCQVHCPTGALSQDYQLDANRCLSYWTIEHRGTIPEEFWPWLRFYWFGCDICQTVCPYNRKSQKVKQTPHEIPPLYEVATMDQLRYEKWFGGTPLTRAKYFGLKRNALIALTVMKDGRLEEILNQISDQDHEIVLMTVQQIRKYLRQI